MHTFIEQYLRTSNLEGKVDVLTPGKTVSVHFYLNDKNWANTTIDLKERKLIVSANNSLGNSTWEIVQRVKQGVPKEMENIFRHILLMWLSLFEQNKEIDVIFATIDMSVFGDTAYELLRKVPFHQLKQDQKDFIQGHFGCQANWFGQRGKNEVIDSLKCAYAVYNAFEEKQKQDPTLEFQWDFKKKHLTLYYQGVEKNYTSHVSAGTLEFRDGEATCVVSKQEDIPSIVETILDEMTNQGKTSTKHYETFVEEMRIRKSIQPLLYEKLGLYYTPHEIETFAAKRKRHAEEVKKTILYEEELLLFRYLQHYFVLDYVTKDVRIYENKEEAVSSFKREAFERKERKLNERLIDFMQDANQKVGGI